MIHVDGQTVVVMESVTDRMRLKDKIVTNVAKAIKSVRLKNWYHYHLIILPTFTLMNQLFVCVEILRLCKIWQ